MDPTPDLLPRATRIIAIQAESEDTRTFVLRPVEPLPGFDTAVPGQFAILSIYGCGEAPFTLAAVPGISAEWGTIVLTVRRAGRLTAALFDLGTDAMVGIRGPYGRGFPRFPAGTATVYIAGGCGLSPLKSAIESHLADPNRGPVAIVYGAREPGTRIHRDALARWKAAPDVRLYDCVERPDDTWAGRCGTVSDFLGAALRETAATAAATCGPPAMLHAIARQLTTAGMAAHRIYLALERYMKCGTGQCGHCYINQRYVCTDGPVFPYSELINLRDAFAVESAQVHGQLDEGCSDPSSTIC